MKKLGTKKTNKKLVLPKKKVLVKKPVAKKKAEKTTLSAVFANLPPQQTIRLPIGVDIVADDPVFIPQYKTEDAVCCDLVANLKPEYDPKLPPSQQAVAPQHVLIQHRAVVLVDCGFSMAVPVGWKAEVVARSGLASQGLIVCNGPGQIDSDYRGRIRVILCNVGHANPIVIKHGERFAQMYLTPVHKFNWQVKTELPPTGRGTGGFGSTGVQV